MNATMTTSLTGMDDRSVGPTPPEAEGGDGGGGGGGGVEEGAGSWLAQPGEEVAIAPVQSFVSLALTKGPPTLRYQTGIGRQVDRSIGWGFCLEES